jgi:hypothetical protein
MTDPKETPAMTRHRERNARTGQYAHGLDAVCACGARRGEHLAEAPYALEERDCDGFREARARAGVRR